MKILHVSSGLWKASGGTSEVVPRLCEALVVVGHEVRLVTGETAELSDAAVRARERGVDLRVCPALAIPHLSFLRVTKKFREEIKEGIAWADVVHIHGLWQDPPWWAAWMCRKMGKRYVIQPHGFLEPERLKISWLKKRVVGALIERPNLNSAAAVIATAESEKQGIEQYGVRVPIRIVPIGIDSDLFDAAVANRGLLTKWGLDSNKKTLLYFSRLTPIKGLDLLAQAWKGLEAFHAGWQLFIAGPDDRGYAQEIQGLYSRLIKDGSVIFSGPIYGEEKNVLLKSVDAFILPTRSENFGIAVQEALLAGVPVVCTKGAPWGEIEEYRCGYWVDVTVKAIEEGLKQVMGATDGERRAMGERGKKLVEERYQWGAIGERMVAVYRDLINRVERGVGGMGDGINRVEHVDRVERGVGACGVGDDRVERVDGILGVGNV